ncbi:multifunctional oxoglutarate decarboxylase/oxoglutarate dehydrogenase thiamine pyrophosphate-binding subunit/dihydrolipoyllysine-residue succinyltransferase subunit [Quadrisphaera sp. DSM 44207]|uniref:multifunctional oxoglutarate decarboxylase/oxoglutarate dehydrogenase thiamine pyrophosphate-binding subunit/dihydrolipoyllysine-residue succinyltransferase subunit n=1 Tax=Quadrisphaera sp. DSM 44207 TaxID=1881057 RepID=UPI00088CA0D7|nr:multifunctional oxoglutarate decarboxylase/oxoglutarate dehydrogenase thiamine pyrophosphate-binding subunit/dihydrolipoyllysine-residue succinyltransferase subunit [Quadrisphaera sp. DSM 44207]SDQ07731.1 2-oxoglutarate dehydrogenase E1 component [Quadrisphaera sp. DSM 44207]
MTQTPTTGSSQQGPGTDPAAEFGANDWLVEDLYQQYLKDRESVDPAWWDYFAKHSPGSRGDDGGSGSGDGAQPRAQQPRAQQPPAQRSSAQPSPQAAPRPAPAPAPAPRAAAPTAPAGSPAASSGAEGVPVPAERRPQPRDLPATSPAARAGTSSTTGKPAAAAPSARTAPPAPAAPAAPSAPARGGRGPAEDAEAADAAQVERLRGPAARVVANMEASLAVPTATSVRAVPAKLLVDNRIVINNHLKRARGGKVSFTHLIGFAVVEALRDMPEMNWAYTEVDGRPGVVRPQHVNFGLAIDLPGKDGTRQLLVPSIKAAEEMDFAHFWAAYEDLVRRARSGRLGVPDFAGTTISLTNPGTIGTVHSVPRLVAGQGTIIGVGAMEYPAEYQGASAETLARLAVSKVMTLTSTYDHRIIQGAQSGEFLRLVHTKLLGQDGFYDRVFAALRIPYEPVRWVQDISVSHDDEIGKTARVVELIHAYRVRGHLMADTDPLEYRQRRHPDLDVQTHGLTLWDLDREFPTGGFGGRPMMLLRDILGVLRDSYCRTVGIEYMHIQDPVQRRWIQERVERRYSPLSREEHLRVLRRLNAAEAFETFLQTKFVGQKRFSLEGGESVIPLLDAVLSDAAHAGLDEVAIGMPHRGRLNVLANIAGKSYGQIFREFEGTQDPRSVQGSGDVKYHLGTEGTFTAEDGATTKVYLAANPSHLEAVDPVLEGVVRAKQDRINLGGSSYPVLPVLLHGDAAFAGQGVVAETLNLSQLRGYRTGGTVHVVINNQVGFTTAPASSRSSFYSTDVARMVQAPIFHVNGDDPEACVRVARLAFEFRQEFAKDVVVDMVCYRRRGHNEGDDPSMTQPLMYNLIEAKRSVRKLYAEALIGRGDITAEEAEAVVEDYRQQLERVFAETRDTGSGAPRGTTAGLDRPASQQDDSVADPVDTAVGADVVARIGQAHTSPPDGFTVHPKLRPLLERRAQMSREGGIDWAYGELLAMGSLLLEGRPVRLAGQDSRRGTFVQRHAVLTDRVTGEEWTPLLYLAPDQARFWVYDSLLSEFAAMGFEYGYSVERPDALVLWEAQFGDFAPGAQTIIDEFIASSEQKWAQRSSVVLLLPHGYEGQGPDHSSARIERFLQLCAEQNMTVAMPSTPASYFHLLRRQAHARPRRPLVVFTPKSMLRLKAASSGLEEFTSGGFRPVLPDPALAAGGLDAGSVDRVLVCSGKVSYDLLAAREAAGDRRTAVVRLEQLYPVDGAGLREALSAYPEDAELVWVQEEPANQGAWPFLGYALPEVLGERRVRRISRPASASPAAGSAKAHQAEQERLVLQALAR